MYDLKKVIEANTIEGVVDYEKVMASLDSDYVNPIVAKKTDKEKLSKEAVSTLVKELGIQGESVDDLKLYIKQMGGSTDEVKEENLKLTNSLKELQGLYDTEVDTRTKLEETTKLDKQMGLIKGLGVEDADQIDYLHYKFNKAVTEENTFESIVEEYAKENGVKTTTRFIKDDFGNQGSSKDLDISEAFQRLNKRK